MTSATITSILPPWATVAPSCAQGCMDIIYTRPCSQISIAYPSFYCCLQNAGCNGIERSSAVNYWNTADPYPCEAPYDTIPTTTISSCPTAIITAMPTAAETTLSSRIHKIITSNLTLAASPLPASSLETSSASATSVSVIIQTRDVISKDPSDTPSLTHAEIAGIAVGSTAAGSILTALFLFSRRLFRRKKNTESIEEAVEAPAEEPANDSLELDMPTYIGPRILNARNSSPSLSVTTASPSHIDDSGMTLVEKRSTIRLVPKDPKDVAESSKEKPSS